MTLKDRWTTEDLSAGNVALSGMLVARIAVPKGELHLVGATGVEEKPSEAFLPPGMRPANPPRLPRRLLQGFRRGVPRWEQVPQNAFRVGALPDSDADVLYLARPNGFINLGLHFILDRIFNINTPATAITNMGISNDTTTVIATTLLIDPTAGAGSPDFTVLGAGVGAAATSRTGNTVTCSAGWEPADFTTVFVITKVGLCTTTTDAGDDTVPTVNGVVNIIGGTGGAAPYNEPFTIDLTTVSDFDLTLQQQITAQAT